MKNKSGASNSRNRIVDRRKPPKPGRESKLSFPKFFAKSFANGFKLFVVENHTLPIVSIGFVVRGGSTFDGKLPGLANMTSELLIKGTKKRSATEIAEAIDYVGGSLSSNASWDESEVFSTVLRSHVAAGVDILQDVVLNASFPEEEIDRVKTQRFAALKQMKADPGYLADTLFASVVFGEHPYGKPTSGTEESVKAMSRADFIAFRKSLYTPKNTFMVFAGDITATDAEKFAMRYFGKWNAKGAQRTVSPAADFLSDGRVFVVDKPAAVQSSLRIGGVGIARNDKNYLKTYVMNTLLGGYFSSRINQNLRETHGYTYGSRSVFDARILPGLFAVSADVRNEVTDETIREIFNELDRIKKTNPTKEELEMVKNYLAGLFPIQLETPQQVARRVIALELYRLPQDYYKRYRDDIHNVTAKDIRVAAEKYIPQKLAIVLSGNSKELSPMLSKFGKVEAVDPDGNKIN